MDPMSSSDQVTINMDELKVNDPLTNAGEIEIDGSHSYRHRSHNNHSNEKKHRRRTRSRSPSPRRKTSDSNHSKLPHHQNERTVPTHDVEPLIHTELVPKVKNTELEEDETSETNVTQSEQNPGVDDGFFIGTRPLFGEDHHNNHHAHDEHPHEHGPKDPHEHGLPYPYSPGFIPNVILDGGGIPQVLPDINVYQQKKNLAQGMMDLALLSANANQLRYVLESYARHPYYWFSVISISVSLILQVAVGVGLILNSRYNVKNKEQICRADRVNNLTVIGIFLITAVNVFIAAFGVADPETS